MIDTFVNLEESINNCLLSRLQNLSHERDYHSEYQARSNKLNTFFPKLMQLLEDVDFRQQLEIGSSTLYSVVILYLELKTEGPWNSGNIKDYSEKLNSVFKSKYDIFIEEIFLKDGDFYKSQEVFDKCIKELHQKMTLDDFKKYPGLVEVYCLLINNVGEYNVTVNPVTVLPIALLLTDDYIVSNKVKGLQCCHLIFKSLDSNAFKMGNYYEVVYRSLKNNIYEKDIDVTKYLFKCLPGFLKILPPEIQHKKMDDIYSTVLDQLNTETNLYRKAVCFNFVTKIIEMHGVHCVKKKIFKDIICDNIDICCNEGVSEILGQQVLECLQMWISHCWCTWKLPADQKILAKLIKFLYTAKDESIIEQIENLIIILINLCTEEDQKELLFNLAFVPVTSSNSDFVGRINAIKEKYLI